MAQSHDFERFVRRFAERLLVAADVKCVDVWRVTGGVIRSVVSQTREGADPSINDTVLDTSHYPSLERTLLDHTPLVIADLRDPRLSPAEVEQFHEWGYAQLAHDAAGRRRRARRAGGPVRRRASATGATTWSS